MIYFFIGFGMAVVLLVVVLGLVVARDFKTQRSAIKANAEYIKQLNRSAELSNEFNLN